MEALRKTQTKVFALTRKVNSHLPDSDETRKDVKTKREIIPIATRNKIEMVKIEDILFVESEDNYSRIFIRQQPTLFVARTLKDLAFNLEPEGFMRVHQSFLIHPAHVLQYDMAKSILSLRSGEKIPVSRANRKKIFQRLSNWTGH